ncbi:SCAN domain-containing protein 3 [Trichonephila clavipes]|nr:SCAN domain-containing protein 3 [Trichonephila clavipes]
MPLSKNTVSSRIDEMGEDIEKQLVEKLKTRKFSVQMDESTLRDSERLQNLIAKNISPVLNEVLHTVIKCVNVIKASAKCERLFKLFCEEQNEDRVRLLLHTEVRWLSKGSCLKRFMELFDTLSDFLNDKPEMKHLLTIDGKAFLNIAKVVGRSVNCIQKILQKFKKTGMLANNEGRGRKKIMNSITERRVIHQVKIDPKISAPKIAASTSNNLGRSVSAETVRRVLRKAGYNGRVARKKPLIGKRNRVKRLKFAKEHILKPQQFWNESFTVMRVSSTSSAVTVVVWCRVSQIPHTTQNTQFLL